MTQHVKGEGMGQSQRGRRGIIKSRKKGEKSPPPPPPFLFFLSAF